MDNIIFGCSTTNKTTSGNYNYYLMSRIDGYVVILREKTDDTEWLFRVILKDENVSTIFSACTSQTYQRPDEMSAQVKKYVVGKMISFLESNRNTPAKW